MNDGLFITGLALGAAGFAVGVWMLLDGAGMVRRHQAARRRRFRARAGA